MNHPNPAITKPHESFLSDLGIGIDKMELTYLNYTANGESNDILKTI
jgi:hypothetical protein